VHIVTDRQKCNLPGK